MVHEPRRADHRRADNGGSPTHLWLRYRDAPEEEPKTITIAFYTSILAASELPLAPPWATPGAPLGGSWAPLRQSLHVVNSACSQHAMRMIRINKIWF